ncbi:nucleic acid dioxygenase ALKBH1 isoform X2 [Daktulosphaira vitifoliae]|uniref:nucleic acid dioxygenase ALKBH1 isoform X2 n=1 Tax=Daktulosphaira vitifoliae TaxID=58002 RepID=UPI0021AA3A41|nr:nucleic acid dioxygenase ALKBH1 isoform X2 [Daktulosphaira vitifoliae]
MFKEKFKYYKNLDYSVNEPDLIDVDKINDERKYLVNHEFDCEFLSGLGLNSNVFEWKCYNFIKKPGLVIIRNPFTKKGEKTWIQRCVASYTRKPNILNIDAHNMLKTDEDWWTTVNKTGDILLKNKLRWATLGYHHNWNTKIYSESARSEFPSELAELSRTIIKLLNFPDEFVAEAAIINFYHLSSTLCGHTDHSEINISAPLLSISFGLSAIFLIGGSTLDKNAFGILLKTGDIVIMSGESRLSFHGIPKVLPLLNDNDLDDSYDWKPFKNFIQDTRININVRQVNN